MFPCIIPAQPGFYAVVKHGDQVVHLPVIAWHLFDEHLANAVTLDGVENAEDTLIVGPDGKQAHR